MASEINQFIAELRGLGVQVWAEGERLRCKAPKGVLTPELQTELAAKKTELLSFLQEANLAAQASKAQIPPAPKNGSLPLSFAQERLWFLDRLEGNSIAYNMPVALRLSGQLQISSLERSLNEIIRRHEILRTSFATVDGTPIQVINAPFRISLAPRDLSHLPEPDRELESERILREDAQQSFDLTQYPLLRVNLLQLQVREYVLCMTIHHTIFDGWSAGVFVRELIALYDGFCSGKMPSLPEPVIQYADFAHWQREWMRGELFDKQLSYWKQQLSGDLPVLELPNDRPLPAQRTFQGATLPFAFSESLSHALNTLSRGEGTSLFSVLLAAFNLLLFRYSGQGDIMVGFPVAGRNRSELEQMIGFFVNTLVLRTNASGNPTFRELLAQVQNTTLDAQANQEMPFERLVAEVQPERELNRQPMFQVMFVLQNAPGQPLELPGLSIAPLESHPGTSMFDLTLEMVEDEQQLFGFFEYSTELFDESTIAGMIEHFTILLQGIVEHPEQRLTEIAILSEIEHRKILVEWNQTQGDYPKDARLHELFEACAAQQADAPAVKFAEQSMSYSELDRKANQLAAYLQTCGVGPDTIVAICVERSLEMIVGILGILKAGGAYLPLAADYPPERLAFLLKDTQTPLLLSQEHLRERLPEGIDLPLVCLDADWSDIARHASEPSPCEASPDNPAYIIYTSGSTGSPKGVVISHRAVVNRCVAVSRYYGLNQRDRVLQFASISFDVSVEEIFSTLSSGGVLVLRANEMSLSFQELLRLSEEERLTVLNLPTAYWHEWVAEALRSQQPFPASLRLVIVGTEHASVERLAEWKQYAPEHVRWTNAYGPTEATITATMYELGKGLEHGRTQSVSIGRPIANTQIYLLDPSLQPVPVGVAGELHIGGESLANGYLNQAELTAEKFIPNPFDADPESRLYKTGDLARYLPDGNIEFLGRIDHQVKIRGFRIELGEIEAALTAHASVREAVVAVREDVPGQKRLLAYVIPEQEQSISRGEFIEFLKKHLPEYMLPTDFVMLDTFPLTPSGKIDRKALPAPGVELAESAAPFVLPRNSLEKTLADIWADVLGVQQVGIHENFFESGGHSLLATRLVFRIHSVFGVDFPLSQIFTATTVALQAECIHHATVHNHGEQRGTAAAANLPKRCPDLRLDPTISPDTAEVMPLMTPASILLTGATGFLGAFLLYELLSSTHANIYCLVRAADTEQGMLRIQKTLKKYHIWNERFVSRIIPVPGELSRPLLGISSDKFDEMAQQIDSIYHNGSLVNFLMPYSELEAPNVLGTQEVLRLACHKKIKSVHYISTLDTVANSQEDLILESPPLDNWEGLDTGYAQSKWMAEKFVLDASSRGLPVCIYRPGRITGHSQTGVWNTDDLACKVIKGCILLKKFPLAEVEIDMTPVDYASKAIVFLSTQSTPRQRIYHIHNPHLISWEKFVMWMDNFGYSFQRLPFPQWRAELFDYAVGNSAEQTAIHSLLPFFFEAEEESDEEKHLQRFDIRNTFNGLKKSSLSCPVIDHNLLHTYFSYLIESSFLHAP